MKTYDITLKRMAYCELKATIRVEAETQEWAEHEAIGRSETELVPDDFTVEVIDLSAFEGSSEVVGVQGV